MEYKDYFENTAQSGQKNSTFAVVSLVLGILGVVFVCCAFYLSFVLGIIGLILGIISLVQNRDGKGLAVTGTILNGLSILISALILIVFLGFVMDDFADFTSQIQDEPGGQRYDEKIQDLGNAFF